MKPVILLADDDEAMRTLLRYNLEKEGLDVVDAKNGEEALRVVAQQSVDLVLLDWMLPKISGIEVCRLLRLPHHTRGPSVIMLTARAGDADRNRCLSVGADDYITKPFSVDHLIARVQAVLRRRETNATVSKT